MAYGFKNSNGTNSAWQLLQDRLKPQTLSTATANAPAGPVNAAPQAPQAPGQPQAQSAPVASAPKAPKAPTGPVEARRGNSFVNLRDYLGANQTTAKAAADRLGGEVQNKFNAADGAYQKAVQDFGYQVSAGTDTFSPYAATTSAQADALAKSTTYRGPEDITTTDAWKNAENTRADAEKYGQALSDSGTRAARLRQTYGAGADSTLDNWMVGTQLGGMSNLDSSSYRQRAQDRVADAKRTSGVAAGAYGRLRDRLFGQEKAKAEADAAAAQQRYEEDKRHQDANSQTSITSGGPNTGVSTDGNTDKGAIYHDPGSSKGLAPGQSWTGTGSNTDGAKGQWGAGRVDMNGPDTAEEILAAQGSVGPGQNQTKQQPAVTTKAGPGLSSTPPPPNYGTMSDADLRAKAKAGDKAATNELALRTKRTVIQVKKGV